MEAVFTFTVNNKCFIKTFIKNKKKMAFYGVPSFKQLGNNVMLSLYLHYNNKYCITNVVNKSEELQKTWKNMHCNSSLMLIFSKYYTNFCSSTKYIIYGIST